MLSAVPSSEGGGSHPLPARYLPVPVVHGLERPPSSGPCRRRGSRATSRRASPGSGRALPVHVSGPGCCWLCQAARGREEGPFQPGLAGLGPHTACACVAAGMLTDVPSSEKGEQGPSYRDSPGSGRAPPCACVAAMTLLAVPSSERGRGSAPPRRASPGSGSAPPVRVAAITLSAVPSTASSERKEAEPSRAGPRPARAAHSLCVCHSTNTAG